MRHALGPRLRGGSGLALAGAVLAVGAGAARAAPTCEGTPSATRLQVIVDGVRSAQGLVTASLYADDAKTFLKSGGSLKVWRIAAEAPSTAMCIWLPAPGAYAVAAYHDANSNMKWDHAALGQIEGVGFSNNPRLFFARPSLESARFRARAGETTIRIRLHYF